MDKEKFNKINDNIENIEIHIYTNIKGEEKKPILFTRSLLNNIQSNNYISLSETPFFITNYQIPFNYIKKMSVENKINTLFNKQLFAQTIMSKGKIIDNNATKEVQNKYIEENIKIILKLLFPTYYPIKENHTDTYSELIERKLPKISDFSSYLLPITSFINSFTKKKDANEEDPAKKEDSGKKEDPAKKEDSSSDNESSEFSYLNIGGKYYTILKVVYLNDFINNLKYNEITNEFFKITEWKSKKNKEIDWNILKFKKEIVELMNKLNYDLKLADNKCDIYKQLKIQYLRREDINRYASISENYKIKNDNIETAVNYLNDQFFKDNPMSNLNANRCDNKTNTIINEIFAIIDRINISVEDRNILKFKINELHKLKNIKYEEDFNKMFEIFNTKFIEINTIINDKIVNNPNKNNLLNKINEYNHEIQLLFTILQSIKELKDTKENINKINVINNKIIRNKPLEEDEKTFLNGYEKKINNEYNDYLEFLTIFNPIYTSNELSIRFTSVFNNRFSVISNLFSKLKLITNIKNTYFENSTNAVISDETKKYFETNYKEYNDFIQIINKFVLPYRESNNEKLVNMISEYIKGNTKDFIGFLTDINNEKIENHKDTLHIIYDELHDSISNKPKYEIQLYVDLIEGKLTKNVLKTAGCYFKDNELVHSYYKQMYKNKYDNKYKFDGKLPVLKITDLNSTVSAVEPVNLPTNASSGQTGGKRKKKMKSVKKHKRKYNIRKLTRKCGY
jgi:hypothetical protein